MANQHHIAVSVRVRPPRVDSKEVAVTVDHADRLVVSSKTFRVAQAVQGSDQTVAYEAIAAPLIEQLRQGYSCTLLAYGQTGSGKTHTVFGPTGCLTQEAVKQADGQVPSSWGLFPRVVCELLNAGLGVLHVSAVEVYQDKAYDLLASRAPLTVGVKCAGRQVGGNGAIVIGDLSNQGHHGAHPAGCRCGKCYAAKKEELAARMAKRDKAQEALKKGVSRLGSSTNHKQDTFSTVGETIVALRSVEEVAKFALMVEVTRTAAGHALNERSSRSHCLVSLRITQQQQGHVVRRKLLFVDLAGSERILKTGVQGTARGQAVAINSSLSALGKVIKALGERSAHVPYRDSTLTMLLRSSLGGRASTSFVINVAPEAEHTEESLCSLEFGERIQSVRNTATLVIGQDASEEEGEIQIQLRNARSALARLEAEGHGGHFGGQAHETRLFKDNIARFAQEERFARQASALVAELKMAGASDAKVAEANARAQAHTAEAANYRDIALRQNSIAGLFTAPKPAYMAKATLVKQLEARLGLLGRAVDDGERCPPTDDASDAELAGALSRALAAYKR